VPTPEMAGAPLALVVLKENLTVDPCELRSFLQQNLRAMASARCIRGCRGASTYLNRESC